MPEDTVSYFAFTPWWWRLAMLYVTIGLALAYYNELRQSTASPAEAVGKTILAALAAPVTAVKLVIAHYTNKAQP